MLVLLWPGKGTGEGTDVEIRTLKMQMMGPLSYDDPRLLREVVKSFLHPPSTKPPRLVEDQFSSKAYKYRNYKAEFAYMFCQKVIRELFRDVREGFFVEAGALDGEFLSNTLPLEVKADWTGLLVEADGDMFDQLLKKRRRVWASHSCLALYPYPHREILKKFSHQKELTNDFDKYSAKAHGSLLSLGGIAGPTLDNATPGHQVYESVQCLPLGTLLLALNVSRVDLVSLDVEGAEEGVLRHFPWGRITVDVWVVEHVSPKPSNSPAGVTPTFTLRQQGDTHSAPSSNSIMPSPEHSVDAEFVRMFASHGYELYTVSRKLSIPNYVFILSESKYNKVLKKR